MWYYARGEEQIGPVEEGAFRILVDQRIVGPSTLVWREGMESWSPYHEIAGTVTDWGTPCSECGRPHLVEELLVFEGRRVCADCKETFFQRMREGHAEPEGLTYAGMGARLGAVILDSLFVNAACIPTLFIAIAVVQASSGGNPSDGAVAITMLALVLLMTVAVLGYFTWPVGRYGATPGKMVLGIQIVRSDGSPVSYMRAFARFWAHQLSGSILYIGYIMACFDEQRRGLHDHICDTRVIVKPKASRA